MKKRYQMTIGVLGSGRWGKRIIATLKELGVNVLVCNTSGVFDERPCFNDWLLMLRSNPDGIIVAANPALHLTVAKQAALLRIPVMLEKPAAFFLDDVLAMDRLQIPILVDYTHLFNPRYHAMKCQINAPIKSIVSIGESLGPFRHFNSLFDYAPHDLAMAMDLLPNTNFELMYYGLTTNQKTKGKLYNIQYKAGDAKVQVRCGNGAETKTRSLTVTLENDKVLTYEVVEPSNVPLTRALEAFIRVINGAEPSVPFALTKRIHRALAKLGKHNNDIDLRRFRTTKEST